ncbi:MAG: hypothetical protein O2973_02850 [Gemmatimonadetes bacterium]|nr:hypothetical protein [Gemmatimonadota bacterium]
MRSILQFARRRALAAAFISAFLPAVSGAQALPDAKALMAKHNAAVGGKALFEKYSSMQLSATMNMAAMGMQASMEMFRAKPNKFVQKIILGPVGEITQGFDGTVAWSMNPMAGAQLVEGDALESVKTNADFFSNLQDPANYTKSETVGMEDFDGRKCYKVNVARGERLGSEYFDAATGLLAGFTASTPSPQGPIESTTVFAEYGDFGGLKLPKRIEQHSPAGDVTITFTAVEFDKVDPAVFELPAAVKALIKP